MAFDWNLLAEKDQRTAAAILGGELHAPDLEIAPDGTPYLYRWHVIPRNREANVYLHVQVASDPERPLHDHPWDNQSVILAGGYIEIVQKTPPLGRETRTTRYLGDTVHREAEEAHRLILPFSVPYTMTLFTTGPTRRTWGFWIANHRGYPTWYPHTDCIRETEDGRSLFIHPTEIAR